MDLLASRKLDPSGRSPHRLVTTLHPLQSLGAAFMNLTEALELPTPTAWLIFVVPGCLAEFGPGPDPGAGQGGAPPRRDGAIAW